VEGAIGCREQCDKGQVVTGAWLQWLALGSVLANRPLAQEQVRWQAIRSATVVHRRDVRPLVAMLESQGNVTCWLVGAEFTCANQLGCDWVALQQASPKVTDEVFDSVVSRGIWCHPPLFHCQPSVGNWSVRLCLLRAKPMMNSAMKVEQAWWLHWLMEALPSTGRNKRRDVVALVVDGTCGGREASICDNGCKSWREVWQWEFYLHGKAVRNRRRARRILFRQSLKPARSACWTRKKSGKSQEKRKWTWFS
jgi:hypothetical protein